jgi:hypothetical protein
MRQLSIKKPLSRFKPRLRIGSQIAQPNNQELLRIQRCYSLFALWGELLQKD